MNNCITKIKNFYNQNAGDNWLKLMVLILNTLNLFFMLNTNWCIPITIIIFALYFKLSKLPRKRKRKMIFIWMTFSLFTIFGESFVIMLNKSTIRYHDSDLFNVSSWLFSAYANMTLSILFLDEYYTVMSD